MKFQGAEPEPRVFLVRNAQPHVPDEVFAHEADAHLFAAPTNGTVISLNLRTSLERAVLITEHRVVVGDGQVLMENTEQTRVFPDRDEAAWVKDVDVETFRCRRRHVHILVMGADHNAVRDRVQAETELGLTAVGERGSLGASRPSPC